MRKKRTKIDDLKTAYHVIDAVQQMSEIRRGWNDFKENVFAFLVCVAAAGVALLVGWWLHAKRP